MDKKLGEMTFEEFVEKLIKTLPQLLKAYQETSWQMLDELTEEEPEEFYEYKFPQDTTGGEIC